MLASFVREVLVNKDNAERSFCETVAAMARCSTFKPLIVTVLLSRLKIRALVPYMPLARCPRLTHDAVRARRAV